MTGAATASADVVTCGNATQTGQRCSARYQRVDPPGWWVFVEEPLERSVLDSSNQRSGAPHCFLWCSLWRAIATSVLLARNLVRPMKFIWAAAAANIGSGALDLGYGVILEQR